MISHRIEGASALDHLSATAAASPTTKTDIGVIGSKNLLRPRSELGDEYACLYSGKTSCKMVNEANMNNSTRHTYTPATHSSRDDVDLVLKPLIKTPKDITTASIQIEKD